MSEPKHSGVNIRVLKALGGVALLATLEEPGDCEAELTVLGTKVCMRQVTNRCDSDCLVGVFVVVEREQTLGTELPVLPAIGQGQVRHPLQTLPVQSVQHLPADSLTAVQRPVAERIVS